MSEALFSIITGTVRYIPTRFIKNEKFLENVFFNSAGEKLTKKNEEIISKFFQITEIEERRYVDDKYIASDIGFFSAQDALTSSGTDKETLPSTSVMVPMASKPLAVTLAPINGSPA